MRGVRPSAPARAVATVATGLLLFGLIAQTATADTKSELAAAKAKLNTIQKRMKATQERLAQLRAAGDALLAQMNAAESSIDIIQAKEQKVRQEMDKVRDRLGGIQGQLDARARLAYQTGGTMSLELILGSSSLSDLSSRLEIVDRATDNDRELIERVEALDAQLRIRQAELRALEGQRLGQHRHLLDRQRALSGRLGSEEELLDQQKKDVKKVEALAKKLGKEWQQQVEAARQIAVQSTTRKALLKPPKPTGPALSKSTTFQICPVDAPRHYVDDFGAPRVGHSHQGNDIMAPYGTPIRAPFPGVATTSNSYAGGLSVYVHGARGFVYNAHLSRLGKLGNVKAGEIIGYVGQTGNARYTAPHDHFEWHPGNGSAISPFVYLNEVC